MIKIYGTKKWFLTVSHESDTQNRKLVSENFWNLQAWNMVESFLFRTQKTKLYQRVIIMISFFRAYNILLPKLIITFFVFLYIINVYIVF